ncbi:hypothetical protein [Empedobacter tilapiae]|uniref:Uncharacterized protein n=1 Tax=Empedobacter tilapiae TaxID=2491114 RepID=A0A4Z1BAW7_9FLAO|nr:hypothetical protein [Empedobacter tilapiae]TGN22220.1 hypothetical protein E4J94_16230 [Empedobacter tilapiae]
MKENELKNNFKVPENYFKNLENEIFLKSLEQRENYTTPTNYFDDLEQSILSKTIDKKETKVIHFNIWWAAACILFIALVMLPFVISSSKKSTEIVDTKTENQVYEKIYDSYIVSDQNKKSSNVTLDDSDFVIYNY